MTTPTRRDVTSPGPTWQVQAVFDPDGTGGDFAYTIGLFDLGLPELHIWARPSLGEDPGADWLLSMSDRRHVLNELGQLLVEGRLDVGSTMTREYDAGLATVTFEVGPPGDPEELEAFGIAPGALVLPVLWSLERAPDGPARELSVEARAEAEATFAAVVAGLPLGAKRSGGDRAAGGGGVLGGAGVADGGGVAAGIGGRSAPSGWELPASPSFGVEQRFGPLTPVVLARAAQLWQADDQTVAHLLRVAGDVKSEVGSLTAPAARAMATARAVGRRHAVEALHEAVHELVDHLTAGPQGSWRWRRIVRRLFAVGAGWHRMSPQQRATAELNFADWLHDVTFSCLAAEVVGDVAEPELLSLARRPWVEGLESARS